MTHGGLHWNQRFSACMEVPVLWQSDAAVGAVVCHPRDLECWPLAAPRSVLPYQVSGQWSKVLEDQVPQWAIDWSLASSRGGIQARASIRVSRGFSRHGRMKRQQEKLPNDDWAPTVSWAPSGNGHTWSEGRMDPGLPGSSHTTGQTGRENDKAGQCWGEWKKKGGMRSSGGEWFTFIWDTRGGLPERATLSQDLKKMSHLLYWGESKLEGPRVGQPCKPEKERGRQGGRPGASKWESDRKRGQNRCL